MKPIKLSSSTAREPFQNPSLCFYGLPLSLRTNLLYAYVSNRADNSRGNTNRPSVSPGSYDLIFTRLAQPQPRMFLSRSSCWASVASFRGKSGPEGVAPDDGKHEIEQNESEISLFPAHSIFKFYTVPMCYLLFFKCSDPILPTIYPVILFHFFSTICVAPNFCHKWKTNCSRNALYSSSFPVFVFVLYRSTQRASAVDHDHYFLCPHRPHPHLDAKFETKQVLF